MRALRRLRADPEAGFTVAELSIAAVFIVIALSLVSAFLITSLVTQRDEDHVILATTQANTVNGNFTKTLPNTISVAVTGPETVGTDTITYLSGIRVDSVSDDGNTATGHCVAWAYSASNQALYTRQSDGAAFPISSTQDPVQIPKVNGADPSTALSGWTLVGGAGTGGDAYTRSPITQTPDVAGHPTAVFTLTDVKTASNKPAGKVLELVYSIGNAYTGQDAGTRNTNAVRIDTTVPSGLRAINSLTHGTPAEGCLS